LAVAAEWSSRVITISAEMVLPALGGYWLDQRLGTRFLFLLLGAAFGIGAAIWQLVRITTPHNKVRRAGQDVERKSSERRGES